MSLDRRRVCLAPLLALGGVPRLAAAQGDDLHNIVDDAWATAQGVSFSGRLVEKRTGPRDDSGLRSSLYRNSRLLFTGGEEGTVQWSAGGLRWQTRADDEGYWLLRTSQPLPPGAPAPGWHLIESKPAASSPAHLLVHDPANTVGLISDLDDTILVSEVNQTMRLLRNSLAVPPESREAVGGMAALYTAWTKRNPRPAATPVFYVSGSPRQLTDSVRRFLHKHGFPPGVLQLKEVSPGSSDPLRDQQAYKVARISDILQAFPQTRFALLGDDGERDPESYAELQARFGAQVLGVWIRRVHPDPKRPRVPGQRDMAELLASGPP
ncbi:App1 family protein [Piscinibacter sp. HJYY11]|uniref:phosphatase domain-containing protein n=1 Tax=Piscinibacter sp. HJYY11 TaxID=2801333 RepID=UPI00192026B7|nr:App1 family protein [Piscinibacter sp. HJYY11]MBL0728403.1 App1 family protein [Piscinibacter sp. HJYY11]